MYVSTLIWIRMVDAELLKKKSIIVYSIYPMGYVNSANMVTSLINKESVRKSNRMIVSRLILEMNVLCVLKEF